MIRLPFPTSFVLAIGLSALPVTAFAQDAAIADPADTAAVAQPAAIPPGTRMGSMRIDGVGRVAEMGMCRGCGERATAHRGTYRMNMGCPDGTLITPYGTCAMMGER